MSGVEALYICLECGATSKTNVRGCTGPWPNAGSDKKSHAHADLVRVLPAKDVEPLVRQLRWFATWPYVPPQHRDRAKRTLDAYPYENAQ